MPLFRSCERAHQLPRRRPFVDLTGFEIDRVNPPGHIHREILNFRGGVDVVQKNPILREKLDALIAPVTDHNHAVLADRKTPRALKLSWTIALFAKRQSNLAVRTEY